MLVSDTLMLCAGDARSELTVFVHDFLPYRLAGAGHNRGIEAGGRLSIASGNGSASAEEQDGRENRKRKTHFVQLVLN